MKSFDKEQLEKNIKRKIESGQFVQIGQVKKGFNDYLGKTVYFVKMKMVDKENEI